MALGNAYGNRFEKSDLPAGEEQWHFNEEFGMTLAVCEGLLKEKEARADAIAEKIQQWYRDSQLAGLGAETLQTLSQLVNGDHWSAAGSQREPTNGNGAAIRLVPLAFMIDPFTQDGQSLIAEVCERIYHNEEAFHGALAIAMAIRLVQNDRHNFIQGILKHLPAGEVFDRLQEISQGAVERIHKVGKRFSGDPRALDTVPLAIYAAQQAPEIGLNSMMNDIVMAGGDSDALCALAGAIAGAYLGPDAISEDWMSKIKASPDFEEYNQTIRDFADFVEMQSGVQTLF